jgi:iron uptake system EfeUOB component EfeO/EfeM
VAVLASACDTEPPATPLPPAPTVNNKILPSQNPVQGQSATQQPYTKVDSVVITLNDFSIVPNNLGLPAGKIRFTVVNQGTLAHDLVISNDAGVIGKTPVFTKADGKKTLDVTLQPGTYKLSCGIPGHADKGMVATLDIR